MATYSESTSTEDAAISADTETEMLDFNIPSGKGGRIKQIRVSYGSVVDAKGATGFCEMKMGSHSGPFRWAVGFGQGGATNTPPQHAEIIDVDIPCLANERVQIFLTLAEAGVSGFVSVMWEGPD